MTPFGSRLRQLRQARGMTQKELARAIGVSSAYLSALEHGKRGRPSWYLVQRIITHFNAIWDDADELMQLARLSHPRVVVDTAGLSAQATEVANLLSQTIGRLTETDLQRIIAVLQHRTSRRQAPRARKHKSAMPVR